MGTKRARKSGGRGVSIFLTLFGLPFLAFGCFACWQVFDLLRDHYDARHWMPTPAEIRFLDLERHSSDDGTTYRVVCHYVYYVDGRQYGGHRVGLTEGRDNIGTWQQDTHARLNQAYQQEQAVTCYVNPADPTQALLDRELRFGWLLFMMGFATVFTSVGGGLVVGGLSAVRSLRRRTALAAQHPDEPWLHRPEWISGTIPPQLGRKAIIAWIFALFWCLISSPILFLLPRELFRNRNYFALLGLLFPLVGASLLIYAIRTSIRIRKFAGTRLRLETLPGVIGGHLRGVLTIAGRIEGIDAVTIELKCVRTYTTGSGKQRQTRSETLWSDMLRREIAHTFGQTSVDLPFAFQIPFDCRPCDDSNASDQINWKLEAHGSAPGVDLDFDFEVPVFRTPQSNPDIGSSPARVAEREQIVDSETSPLPEKIVESQDGHGNPVFTISSWVSLTFFAVFVAVDAVLMGVAAFSLYRVTRGEWFMLLFLLVFGLVGLLFTFMLLSLFGRYCITLVPGGLRIERHWGPFGRTRELDAGQVTAIKVKECASMGDRKYYALYCPAGGKRKTPLAVNIPGELPARWLARRIEEHLREGGGLSPAEPQAAEEDASQRMEESASGTER